MMTEKEDRRVRRTRRRLQRALAELILEKRYEKITVQNIIDRADVGRSTFYAHYLDKEDLLVSSFTSWAQDLDQHLQADNHAEEEEDHLLHSLTFFRHADEQFDLYRAMLEGGGGEVLVETGREHMQADICRHLEARLSPGREPVIPVPVIANFLAGALWSLLMWWLAAGRPYPPEQINKMFHTLAMSGIAAVTEGEGAISESML